MRAVLQRVTRASVTVADRVVGEIGPGLCVLLGAGRGDEERDRLYIVDKVVNLRIFADDEGKMNRSVRDIGGEVLLVSQFTLYGDARKGRRPSFITAMAPDEARAAYEQVAIDLRAAGVARVATGQFAATMAVELVNDGPVTILLDSSRQL